MKANGRIFSYVSGAKYGKHSVIVTWQDSCLKKKQSHKWKEMKLIYLQLQGQNAAFTLTGHPVMSPSVFCQIKTMSIVTWLKLMLLLASLTLSPSCKSVCAVTVFF